jgi:hypothetical protein
MDLDAESKRRVKNWLVSKLGDEPKCRMCGDGPLNALGISLLPALSPASPPMVTIDRSRRRDNITVTSNGQAVVNLQCQNCGYCHLFDAKPMGVSLPIG